MLASMEDMLLSKRPANHSKLSPVCAASMHVLVKEGRNAYICSSCLGLIICHILSHRRIQHVMKCRLRKFATLCALLVCSRSLQP